MKRFLCTIMCVSVLMGLCGCDREQVIAEVTAEASCSAETAALPIPEAESYHFTADTFPTLSGSSSMRHLGWAAYSALTSECLENATYQTVFTSTVGAYLDVLEGRSKIALTMEIPQAYQDSIYRVYSLVHKEVIAREGLIFVVSANNPVDSVTIDQLRNIYSGNITNWKQLGGVDVPVQAYHYGDNSGAQVLLEQQVMEGAELITPQTAIGFPTSQEGYNNTPQKLICSFETSPGAIGFTLFRNQPEVLSAEGLKILKVEGIHPDKDTISIGTYPLVGNYCAYISQLAEKNSSEEILFRWLISTDGQKLIEKLGYIPACPGGELMELRNMEISGNEYSVLTKQTFHTELNTLPDELVASDNYGTLYPYYGSPFHKVDEENGYSHGMLPRFGFLTKPENLLQSLGIRI